MQKSNQHIDQVLLVPGLPHVLLAPEKSKSWQKLRDSYASLEKTVEASDADVILYFSTQWMSVLGYMVQGNPNPRGSHVDDNWHELGTMSFDMQVDSELSASIAENIANKNYTSKLVNYEGFPIDSGTIVADSLLNPKQKKKVAIISCNIYANEAETKEIGNLCLQALKKQGKKAIVVLVSSLSHRFHVTDIDPEQDCISSQKDDEWNRKVLELLSAGDLEKTSEICNEFASQANADMGFKALWWLNGLSQEQGSFKGEILEYQPVWGTGAATVKLELVSKPITQRRSDQHTKGQEATTLYCPDAPKPVGSYPHARRVGDLLYLSGMGPRSATSKQIPGLTLNADGTILDYDIEIQTKTVIENISKVLSEAGSSLDNIVDIQVYLTNMKADFEKFNRIYSQYFKQETGPTRTTVEVNSLPTPIAVEFKVIAKL